MPDREERQLSRIRAVWHALRSVDVSHYPRFLIDDHPLRFRRPINDQIQWLADKFPTQRNREV